MRACRIRGGKGDKQVEYELDLGIRRIKYVLRHDEQRPRRVAWSLVSGDMMKVSNGSWELADDGGRTRAIYSVEIQIARPPLVPQALVDRVSDELTKIQLPKTLDGVQGARGEPRLGDGPRRPSAGAGRRRSRDAVEARAWRRSHACPLLGARRCRTLAGAVGVPGRSLTPGWSGCYTGKVRPTPGPRIQPRRRGIVM